jgi:hypothetical protein
LEFIQEVHIRVRLGKDLMAAGQAVIALEEPEEVVEPEAMGKVDQEMELAAANVAATAALELDRR